MFSRRQLALALLALGVVAHPVGTHAQAVGEFDPAGAGLPLFRPQGTVAVVALATSTWEAVPTDPHQLLGDYQFLPHFATEDTRGQLFHVLEAEAGWEGTLPDDNFVAVPWTIGCGCAEEGWDQPGWVPPGDTVVFLLSQTRRRARWDGPPVFDVLGWHQPYPVGDFIPYWRHTRADPPSWLSVQEFFRLLRALPSEVAFRLDPASSLTAVLGWLEENPGKEGSFPMPTVLWELERLTGTSRGERGGGGGGP